MCFVSCALLSESIRSFSAKVKLICALQTLLSGSERKALRVSKTKKESTTVAEKSDKKGYNSFRPVKESWLKKTGKNAADIKRPVKQEKNCKGQKMAGKTNKINMGRKRPIKPKIISLSK